MTPKASHQTPAAQVAELRKRYAALKDAAAPENTPATLLELRASNLKLGEAVKKLREDIEKSLTTLPNGERILTGEYAALCELARLNGVKEDEVIAGVREVSCGRVTELLLIDLGLTDLAPLSGLMALTKLALSYNQISGLSALSELTALTGVWLHSNQIRDLSPLSGLKALTVLGLGKNQISDLSPLSGLTALTELGLEGNQISDLSPLSRLTGLTSLGLILNPLSSESKKIAAKLKTKGVDVYL